MTHSHIHTPGLFDLQVNGYAGVDFNDPSITPKMLDQALEAMLADGVTGCLPTIITATPEELKERFRALDQAVSNSVLGPTMVPGYHLEGPFLNDGPGYRGCHPAAAMTDPRIDVINELDGLLTRPILLVTLAPERHGAIEQTALLAAAGKTIAIAHSEADFATVRAAADAGLSMSTHLGNGLPQTLPKLQNTLLAQLSEPRLSACFIADGHHLSAEALASLVYLKGINNCILVSDAVLAAAAQPGPYRFAGMEIILGDDGAVRQPEGVGLAGSALRLDQAVRNLVEWKIAQLPKAAAMASVHPIRAMEHSFRHYGIKFDMGKIEWNSAMEAKVVSPGGVESIR